MKLLFITSRYPFPIDKGDKLRAYHQIIELSKSNEVHLISFTEKNIIESDYLELKKYCASVNSFKINLLKRVLNLLRTLINNKPFQVNYFYCNKIQRKINILIKEIKPNHIYCQLIRTALYMRNQHAIPSTIDYMDALSKGIERRISISKFWMKPILKIEHQRLKKFENLAYEFFDNHVIISESDRYNIAHKKNNEITIIPNGINSDEFKPITTEKKYDLVFIGNLNYVPNIEAASYIVKEILPILVKKYPAIKILIAGSNPSLKLKKLSSKNVDIKGWMEDIKEAYCSGKVFFAPMMIGTGLQNKLLEAMSLEIPCITSSLANKSLKASNNENILIGENIDQYINHILYCIENKDFRENLGKKGKAFVIENYNWSNANKLLLEIFQSKQSIKV